MNAIRNAISACETFKKTPLLRSHGESIFGDYGKPVMYTCANVQVSQNSCEVLDAAPFMKEFLLWHWKVLMRLMQCAEYCFEAISDHQV